jgi:hypothetical protein
MPTTRAPTSSVFATQVRKRVCSNSVRKCSSVGGRLKMKGLCAVFVAPTYRSLFCLNVVTTIQ